MRKSHTPSSSYLPNTQSKRGLRRVRDSNPRGVAACLVSGEVHSSSLPTLQTAAGLTDGGGSAINCFYMTRPLSGAGCLSDEVFFELNPSARPCRVVVHDVLDRLSAAPQPADDLPQLGSLEQPRCLLYRQPPARQQVGEDFALWVSYHILVVLVCTRIGGQATPGIIIVLSISPGGPNRSYHRSFGTCAGRSRISAICLLTAESSKRPHA